MTEPIGVDRPAAARRPRSITFHKRRNSAPLTPEQSRRQTVLLRSAWRHFGEAAPMIAFLNARHSVLEGQPLRLAVESDEGLKRVELLLR